MKRFVILYLFLPFIVWGKELPKLQTNQQPFLAIWRAHEGSRPDSKAPDLRIAIWNDGRVVFAKEPAKWGGALREGHVDPVRIATLKTRIQATALFELKEKQYIVPDGSMNCLAVDLGKKKQILSWDEVDIPNYGINAPATGNGIEFKKVWGEVNQLALDVIHSILKESQPYNGDFKALLKSWRFK